MSIVTRYNFSAFKPAKNHDIDALETHGLSAKNKKKSIKNTVFSGV